MFATLGFIVSNLWNPGQVLSVVNGIALILNRTFRREEQLQVILG